MYLIRMILHKIVIHPDKYRIHIINKKMEVFFIFGTGAVQSDSFEV